MCRVSDRYTSIYCLYNINSLSNLKSIMQYGILSKNLLKKLNIQNTDISNLSVQSIRDFKRVPNHGPLHDYANLYFDARNPMLYYLVHNKDIDTLCILCIDKRVLDLPETVVTDRNAAASLAIFESPDKALELLNFGVILSQSWDDKDSLKKDEKKKIKCAEVLILNKVPIEYILCVKVGSEKAKQRIEELNLGLPIYLDRNLFFNR